MVQGVLLGLLFLVPVVFSRWTEDAWDYPKWAVATLGAMLLAGWGLAYELARIRGEGLGAWIGNAWGRVLAMVRRDPLGGALLLFVLSSLLSTLASPNPGLGFFGAPGSYAGLLGAFATTSVYFAARSLGGHPTSLARLAVAAALAAGVASAYALAQFVGKDPLDWGLIAFLRGLRRTMGTLGQPNLLAGYLVMCVPLIVWLGLRSQKRAGRLVWAALGIVCLAAIGTTLSRASWLALGLSAVVGVLLYLKATPAAVETLRRPRNALIVASVLALGLVAMGLFLTRTPVGTQLLVRMREIASLRETGNAARIVAWRSGLRMAASKPLLGVGTDQFGLDFPAFRTATYYRLEHGQVPRTAHNAAVNVLVNQGALGFLAGLLVFVFTVRTFGRGLRHGDPAVRAGVVAAAATLSGFLFWDLVNYTVAALGVLAAALAGWASGASANAAAPPSDATQPISPPRPPVWSIATSVVLVVIALVPVIVNPLRAQMAKRVALDSPIGTLDHFRSLERASALAPWDGRHVHFLATSFLRLALSPIDSTRRLILLDRARAAEESAIGIESRNALFYAGYGSILTQLSKAGAAQISADEIHDAFRTAIARDPVNPDILKQAAEAMIGVGRYADARALALDAAVLYPELAEPLAVVGLIALLEKRLEDAADTLALASTRDWLGDEETRAKALSNLAGAYIGLQRFEEAKAAADQALEADPELAGATQNRDLAARGMAQEALLRE